MTKYDEELQQKIHEAELLQEQIGLLQRVREIELERNGTKTELPKMTPVVETGRPSVPTVRPAVRPAVAVAPAATVAPAAAVEGEQPKKRRGRPPGSTNVPKVAESSDGKSVDLPSLLESLAQQVNKPLTHAELVTMAREAGYTTKAKDFSNMVYQCILKLVKKGRFKKNDETREYELTPEASAA